VLAELTLRPFRTRQDAFRLWAGVFGPVFLTGLVEVLATKKAGDS
jgi:hypothetical protein